MTRTERIIPQKPASESDEHKRIMDMVRSWRAVIERSADTNEQADCLGSDVRELLEQSNILSLNVPRSVGGTEAHPQLGIDVVRELSYYDASTGWYAGASMTGSAVAGAFLGDRAVEKVFAMGAPRCAGQVAPTGKAEKVGDDSYRIAGTYAFGSGLPSANWVIGGYVLHENGIPVKTEAGIPRLLMGFVPKAKVEILGNWNVLGLRGTASFDYRVPEQIVHEDFMVDLTAHEGVEPKRGGPLYRMGGFRALACIHHGSVALGCTTRAVEEWAAFANGRVRPTGGIAVQQHTLHDLALAAGEIRGMEAYLRGALTALYDAASRNEVIPDQLKIDARLAASVSTEMGVQITQRAFNSCSAAALRNGSRLQRCYRDMQAAVAHVFTGEVSLIQLGSFLAGVPGTRIEHYL
jgi:alkylation response protein AidB-like acyl-CoA dehydrogenase